MSLRPIFKSFMMALYFFILYVFFSEVTLLQASTELQAFPVKVFNIKDFGASGQKSQNAQQAIQQAVDACFRAGGGIVYVPPGEYSSGTIHLCSHVRFYVEAGATIYSIKDKDAFDQDALFYGQDLFNITLEGRGTINGQAEYQWRDKGDFHDDFIYPNQLMMEKGAKPLIRSFPKPNQYGKLVLLIRCKDVLIRDLSFIDSPSWIIHPYGCERLTIDGVYIRSSLKEGVWADGIDPDGCKDVRIANSTIETGDDGIGFYSMNWFGPALPCENIIITNCRLSSASSAIKFCDGNMNAVRRVLIQNVIARGKGMSTITGHPESWLEDVAIENLRLSISHDPEAAYDKAVNALEVRLARNLRMRNVDIVWDRPYYERWQNAVHFENVKDLEIDNLRARQARADDLTSAAIVLDQVAGAIIRNCQALSGTGTFLRLRGEQTRDICFFGNKLSLARRPVSFSEEVKEKKIRKLNQ